MRTPDEYLLLVRQVIGATNDQPNLSLSWNTLAEARLLRKQITQMQKELRLVKKDLGLTIKAIRSAYSAQRAKVGTGVGAGIAWGLMKGHRRVLGQVHRMERLDLRRQQDAALYPYLTISRMIDGVLVQMDAIKVAIERSVLEMDQKGFMRTDDVPHASAPPPPPISLPSLDVEHKPYSKE